MYHCIECKLFASANLNETFHNKSSVSDIRLAKHNELPSCLI